jgi:hypothetical protein
LPHCHCRLPPSRGGGRDRDCLCGRLWIVVIAGLDDAVDPVTRAEGAARWLFANLRPEDHAGKLFVGFDRALGFCIRAFVVRIEPACRVDDRLDPGPPYSYRCAILIELGRIDRRLHRFVERDGDVVIDFAALVLTVSNGAYERYVHRALTRCQHQRVVFPIIAYEDFRLERINAGRKQIRALVVGICVTDRHVAISSLLVRFNTN